MVGSDAETMVIDDEKTITVETTVMRTRFAYTGSRSCSVVATVGELWTVTKATLRGEASHKAYWNTFGWPLLWFHRYVLVVEHLDLAPSEASRTTVVLASGTELSVIDNERDDAARVWFLVHGLSSNARLWDGVLSRLSSRGDRVIAVDQRGHGQSPRSRDGYEMASVADDLAELAQSVAASERFLVGQSWGGNVVVECAARHPGLATGVVGIDGGFIRLRDHYPEWELCWEALAPPVLEGMPLQRITEWLEQSAADWPEEGRRGTLANFHIRSDGTISPRLARDDHRDVLAGLWRHEPQDALVNVDVPVRFFVADSGDEERRRQRRLAIESLMESTRSSVDAIWFEGAHHDVHAQRPADVETALQTFAEHCSS